MMTSEDPEKLRNKDGTPWDRKSAPYRRSGARATRSLRLEAQLASGQWSTPRVKTPSENPNKLYNKDGTLWDRKGQAYRPSGSTAQSNLRLEAQLESGEW